MFISQKASRVAESMTLAIDAKAKAMKASGLDIIGFGAGEPDFDTPSFIKDAAKAALDKGLTKYTPVPGILELRQAICDKLQNKNGVKYGPNDIVVSNGAKHSLFNVFQCILDPGDEVLITAPYWVSYPEMVKMADGVPVFVETFEKDGFVPAAAAIEAAVTAKTRAIIVNSPGNPCGNLFDREQLGKIGDIAVKHGLYIVSDEIYEDLIYDGNTHVCMASLSDEVKARTIIVNGFSKSFSMTGWRLGYTACGTALAKAMSNYQSHATSNANTFSQYAALTALQGGTAEKDAMVKEFAARRDILHGLVNGTPLVSGIMPKGAFYYMANISGTFGRSYKGTVIDGSLSFCDLLLENANVAAVPGIAFGTDAHIRLSYAMSRTNMEKGLQRIAEFTSRLE